MIGSRCSLGSLSIRSGRVPETLSSSCSASRLVASDEGILFCSDSSGGRPNLKATTGDSEAAVKCTLR